MKTVIIALLFLMAACTKQNVNEPLENNGNDYFIKPLSTSNVSNAVVDSVGVITFTQNASIDTVYSTTILNTIKDGSFTVSDSCRLFKWTFPVNGTTRIDRLALFVNGYKVPTKPTFENGVITVAPQFNVIFAPGNYFYEMKCHVYNGAFQVSLTEALCTNRLRFYLNVSGLPDLGDYFNGDYLK